MALAGFALATSGTPGPNTMMVTASAAQFGIRPVLPHMLGITLGFPAMIVAVALGLGLSFAQIPGLHLAMQWVGAAWLLWLAWKIAAALPAFTTPGQPILPQALVVAAVFALVSLPCLFFWAWIGRAARHLLGEGARLRAFNIAMAVLLVLSLLPLALG